MSSTGSTAPSRRERRLAERAARRTPTATARPPFWRSPLVVLTAAALIVGLALVAIIALMGGGGGGSGSELVTPVSDKPLALRDGRSLGSASAPVSIELWEDFQCPVCARFTAIIEPLLLSAYVKQGDVRLTFHDMAFIGPESIDAAIAARAAGEQGAFWTLHDLLYANQGAAENKGAFSRARLTQMADLAGLDRDAFLAALDDPANRTAVTAETADGRALGVSSTPTLVINGQLAPGLPGWDQLSAYLDSLLAATPISAPHATPGTS